MTPWKTSYSHLQIIIYILVCKSTYTVNETVQWIDFVLWIMCPYRKRGAACIFFYKFPVTNTSL